MYSFLLITTITTMVHMYKCTIVQSAQVRVQYVLLNDYLRVLMEENREYIEYVGMRTKQCVRILVLSRTQVHCVTVCSGLPIEMQIRLRGARETISVI